MQCSIKEFYCGIDLSASKTHLCLITEQHTRLIDKGMSNDFYEINSGLHPYQPSFKIVVESTINWKWLVYELQNKSHSEDYMTSFQPKKSSSIGGSFNYLPQTSSGCL